ncbi:MAG: hypothetical protein MJ231_06265, partial [bacterium]|nr:hypothetical protein [bacterium]
MGFWDKFINLKNQINQVENSVYYGNRSYVEVYEKNVQLESEIAARTRELDTANKQMVTLQHIWDMMNSSKPLSSVLTAVVNNLQGELGYLHSCIAKKMFDDKGEYYQILACSGELFGENFYDFFKCEPYDL